MPDETIPSSARIDDNTKQLMERDDSGLLALVINVNPDFGPGAKVRIQELVKQAITEVGNRSEQNVALPRNAASPFVHANLQAVVLKKLLELDAAQKPGAISAVEADLEDGKIFNPDNLIKTVISIPMLRQMEADEISLHSVMIEINVNYVEGRPAAMEKVQELVGKARQEAGDTDLGQGVSEWKTKTSAQYIYAKLQSKVIRRLAELDAKSHSIYRIWPDFKVHAQIWKSVPTVKGDACRRSFATRGNGIVWAIFDSGIDASHPHFQQHQNLVLDGPLRHMDFMGLETAELPQPADDYGHGTHVAGIIAGELDASKYQGYGLTRERDHDGKISYQSAAISDPLLGVAPECKLVSYKILDSTGEGEASTVIAAIQTVQELNGYGRQLVIHGVNMSLGYGFLPEWFACGQSPLCVEVDRLVRSGVVVVVSAGNTGKNFTSINDPGNAEYAITVGATHRDSPHTYGVSYFSSKGPTGDGRRKPDLLAPGEKIVSCGAGPDLATYQTKAGIAASAGGNKAYYLERSGTSMAAPHVSGIIAGLLSVRSEFRGRPDVIKRALLQNATDLGRDLHFQGRGLVDMMRTIQAV
jgi:serine protease AprX